MRIESRQDFAAMPTPEPAPARLHCSRCDYDLRGLTVVGTCPECGYSISKSARWADELRLVGGRLWSSVVRHLRFSAISLVVLACTLNMHVRLPTPGGIPSTHWLTRLILDYELALIRIAALGVAILVMQKLHLNLDDPDTGASSSLHGRRLAHMWWPLAGLYTLLVGAFALDRWAEMGGQIGVWEALGSRLGGLVRFGVFWLPAVMWPLIVLLLMLLNLRITALIIHRVTPDEKVRTLQLPLQLALAAVLTAAVLPVLDIIMAFLAPGVPLPLFVSARYSVRMTSALMTVALACMAWRTWVTATVLEEGSGLPDRATELSTSQQNAGDRVIRPAYGLVVSIATSTGMMLISSIAPPCRIAAHIEVLAMALLLITCVGAVGAFVVLLIRLIVHSTTSQLASRDRAVAIQSLVAVVALVATSLVMSAMPDLPISLRWSNGADRASIGVGAACLCLGIGRALRLAASCFCVHERVVSRASSVALLVFVGWIVLAYVLAAVFPFVFEILRPRPATTEIVTEAKEIFEVAALLPFVVASISMSRDAHRLLRHSRSRSNSLP